MEAKECKIQDILTENKKYVIPAYQRPYSWSTDNAEQLIDDIYQSYISEDREYFIGSMICINKGDNIYEVVDGQQRLTTLSLILSQLKSLIKYQGIKDDLQKRILPIDVYSEETDEPRLMVRSKENNLYRYYILQGKTEYKPERPSYTESLFIENQKVIGDYLKSKTEQELKDFAKYILQNVFVVFVQTDDISSSFRLFNVLNNRGMSLSNADLLKNTLFEYAIKFKKESSQVENAWSEIEEIVGVDNLDKFLTLHKISEKKDRDRVIQKNLESYISSLRDEFNNDPVEMSLALLTSAKNYVRIRDNDLENKKIQRVISSLSNLTVDEWMPPLIAFLNRVYRKKNLSHDEFYKFIELFEKVYMQGWIKKQIKSSREIVCYYALVAINNDYTFQEILASVSGLSDNEGFLKALDSDMYEPRPNQFHLVKTILLRLDVEQQDESVLKTYSGRVTIEHVLPQKLSDPYWTHRFSNSDHSEWLHKLGNLTLISGHKNSEAQNSDFERKKEIYKKHNNKVSFDITRDLCDIPDFDKNRLIMRHERLKSIIKKLWTV